MFMKRIHQAENDDNDDHKDVDDVDQTRAKIIAINQNRIKIKTYIWRRLHKWFSFYTKSFFFFSLHCFSFLFLFCFCTIQWDFMSYSSPFPSTVTCYQALWAHAGPRNQHSDKERKFRKESHIKIYGYLVKMKWGALWITPFQPLVFFFSEFYHWTRPRTKLCLIQIFLILLAIFFFVHLNEFLPICHNVWKRTRIEYYLYSVYIFMRILCSYIAWFRMPCGWSAQISCVKEPFAVLTEMA